MKKYELIKTDRPDGLYQIKALRGFSDVKEGDLGGYVKSEDNLSHEGNCWIYNSAVVYGCASVCDNARVFENARVCDNARVYGNAMVSYNAKVYGDAAVYGSAMICYKARVYGDAEVYSGAVVYGCASVCDYASVSGYVRVCGSAIVCGNAMVCDNAIVCDNAMVCGNARVYDNAMVSGSAVVCDNAMIKSNADYIVFKNWWSSGRYFTWTRSNNMWSVGCFRGNGGELIKKAYQDSYVSGREYERIVKYVETLLRETETGQKTEYL